MKYNQISIKSLILVSVQFICIYLLFHLTPVASVNIFSILLIACGSFIGVWAVYSMRKSTLRINPEVSHVANLITDGPYHYLRHPMYTSVLLVCLGLLIVNMTLVKAVIYVILICDLIVKLQYEESMLMNHFENYKLYTKKTWRIIPYLY